MSSKRNEMPQADARTFPWTNDEVDKSQSLVLYQAMLRIRIAEEGIAELLEQKEICCPTHLYTGQEAIAVGVCAALNQRDYIFGGHRSHGHYLAKGGDLRALMAELYGRSTGCAAGRGGSMHLIATEVGLMGTVPLVAATIPIAVGAALASKLRA
ncbi:MAG: thiamine pyrophosphate-dependent enzyme, partial [Candidatus Acidiferrum sp.]